MKHGLTLSRSSPTVAREMSEAKTVVVTGAFGFVGLALTRHLAKQCRVIAVGHEPRADIGVLPEGVQARYGDVSGAYELLNEHTSVVHLAGGGGESACRADPVAATANIVQTTLDLAQRCRSANVPRLVYSSTIAVYGTHREHDGAYRESDQPLPDDLYGTLKYAAESAVRSVPGGVALRIANIYGAGSGIDVGVQGVAERFARAAARSQELSMYGDGSQRIDFVHVDDVCRAIEASVLSPTAPAAINIGGGATLSIRELADAAVHAGKAHGAKPTLTSKPAPEGKLWPTRSLDITLAREALQWHPAVPLQDGMTELVRMMRTS